MSRCQSLECDAGQNTCPYAKRTIKESMVAHEAHRHVYYVQILSDRIAGK